MKIHTLVIVVVALLASCHQPATAQTDAAAMKAYKKQKFRFEVRDCPPLAQICNLCYQQPTPTH